MTDSLYNPIGASAVKSGLPIGVKQTGESHLAYTVITSPYEWEPEQAQSFFARILGDFPTSVDDIAPETPSLPEQITLSQNYPNPFNPSTTIHYALPKTADVTLSIYSILGQKVATLVDARAEAGNKTVSWNAPEMASGVYLMRLETSGAHLMRKMVLLK